MQELVELIVSYPMGSDKKPYHPWSLQNWGSRNSAADERKGLERSFENLTVAFWSPPSPETSTRGLGREMYDVVTSNQACSETPSCYKWHLGR